MEEGIIWLIIAVVIIVVLLGLLSQFVLPAVYVILAALAVIAYFLLDQVFCAAYFPHLPWLMWLICGALIGGALGFWTIAPIYGLRNYRRLIIWSPILLILVMVIARVLYKGPG